MGPNQMILYSFNNYKHTLSISIDLSSNAERKLIDITIAITLIINVYSYGDRRHVEINFIVTRHIF